MRDVVGAHEETRRLRLAPDPRRLALWSPVAFGLGVQLYFLAPREPPLWAAIAALGGALALSILGSRGGIAARAAAFGLGLVLAGFGAASLRAHAVAAPVLAAEVAAAVEGRIVRIDQSQAGLPRLTLAEPRIYGLAAGDTPARVRVTLGSPRFVEGLRPGDRVSVLARLGPPGGPAEPGAFDFRRSAWFDRLGAVGLARGPVAVIAPSEGGSLETLRHAIGESLRTALSGETGAFAAALAVGDRRGIPPEALAALRDSSLQHMLSISGLHMSLVCGVVFVAVRFGLALVPGLALRRPIKKVAALASLGAGGLYFGLSGGDVATERAFVMVAVALSAVLLDRPALSARALALAALVILVRAPESLLDAGFQMSFAATLALVAFFDAARGSPLIARGRGARAQIAVYVGGVALTSLVAGLATAPFGAFHFDRVSLYGLPANLLATPALGFVVTPALIGAALAAPFGLEGPFLAVAGHGVDWMMRVARIVAAWPDSAQATSAAAPAALWLTTFGGLALALSRAAPGRAAGVSLLALALVVWSPGPRPDILVAPAGGVVGVMTAAGRAVSAAGRDRYAVQTWLRRDGDSASPDDALARSAFVRHGAWREARSLGGVPVFVHDGRRLDRAGARARCAPGAVIVIPGFDWRDGSAAGQGDGLDASESVLDPFKRARDSGCLVLDRLTLAGLGAASIRPTAPGALPGALRLEAEPSGRRLWSGARPGARSQP